MTKREFIKRELANMVFNGYSIEDQVENGSNTMRRVIISDLSVGLKLVVSQPNYGKEV